MFDIFSQFSSINVVKDIAIPTVTAFGAVFFATRKFKHEHFWKDKYIAYQRVLSSIEAIRYWADEMNSTVHMLPCVGDFEGKKPHEFYSIAQREVIKQATIGSILLSKKFVSKLNEFHNELRETEYSANDEHPDNEQDADFSFASHATVIRNIADKYLSQLISLARDDLQK